MSSNKDNDQDEIQKDEPEDIENDLDITPNNDDPIESVDSVGTDSSKDSESTPAPTPISALEEQLQRAQSDLLYLRAEFDNYKKQAIKERALLIKFGAERFMTELLEVVDIFNTAMSIEMTGENLDSFHDGVKMTAHELENVMERFGLVKIESLNQAFNPNKHEAVGSEESKEVTSGHICRVYKDAYNLHGKIIRPAQVIVAK